MVDESSHEPSGKEKTYCTKYEKERENRGSNDVLP